MSATREIVIVTGSSGFIGRALVERLAERYTVVGFDREIPPHPPVVAECVCVDLTSQSSIQTALQRVRVAYGEHLASVIHLAAYFDLTGEPNPKYDEITVRGAERLLRELQTFRLEQFVFASSMLIHAPSQPGERINEDSPLDPKPLPYRQSKISAERVIHERRGQTPVVYIRPSGVYDDYGHAAFLAHQIASIYERKLTSRVYPGNLDTGQPYIHLDDLIDAVLRIVDRRKSLPAEIPILLGEAETLTFRALQEHIGCLIHGEQWETRQIPKTLARIGASVEENVLDNDPFIRPWMVDASSDHYELDLSRARTLLGWEPRRTLRTTLPTIVSHLNRDPSGWYRTNKLNPAVVADQAPAVREHHAMDHAMDKDVSEHKTHMRQMHLSMLWVHFTNMVLGAWLATSPFVFGSFDLHEFSDAVLRVTAERNLAPPQLRMALLGWSDVISGLLIVLFGALSLSRRFSWAQWANAAVGSWLLFAPLIFWSPSAAVYTNETLVGALVIAFAILVPMMPGMSRESMMDESELPIGWSYSPSTYEQRLPIIALGFVGLLISRTLTAYQLGHIEGVWEPFFAGQGGRNGTEFIITSDVSKAWPIPDAGLGAVSYLFEVLMGVMGGRQRWRTMPWMVAAFGIVVVPLGVVSIYFIIIQPIMIGTWCTLCLAAALAMLIMIPFTLDELVAMGQYLVQSHRRGESLLRTFFMGGASPGSGKDTSPGFGALATAARAAVRGITVPWTLAASAVLGAGLMFTRLLFDTVPPMAHSDHVVGALVVTVAVMAMAEVGRTLRFVNVVFGIWLVVAPWILDGASLAASWTSVVIGVVLVLLSLPRGARSREHYGSWDRYVL